MAQRAETSTAELRVLLDANRWAVTAGLMATVFVGIVAVAAASPVSLRDAMQTNVPTNYLFQALTGAIITGVTLAVTINQLVLSQELGAVQAQRERLEGSMEFRRDAETTVDLDVSPPEPASFLRAIVAGTRNRATEFGDAVEESGGSVSAQPDVDRDRLRKEIDQFVDNVVEHADSIEDELEDAQFGTYEVLQRAMDYNYSWKLFRARRIRNDYADDLSDEADEEIDELIETLKLFGLAREHFKTLYFQWELINLSRAMMYVAVPALIVTTSMVLFFDVAAAPGSTLGIANVTWVVVPAVTIAVTPFLVLVSFMLRIATMAKRTLAIGPFILRESSRGSQIAEEEEV